ncbi:O-acetyl-ADP-ribose deacetylase [Paenibacillus silvae]|uniref:O-acetyl-ADP-ribose deacetylase n=1 Tax=Paenibacillus silvae TaxID=1325358 RepID=UPI0020049CC9|nr:O-acetyl-ADP-ribose deacetylase [Paenibacillus silvae]MCK6073915.1 O-acetyl-ADP-ribose deacetylase [Paenibacillus silvae]MCK6148608.1 O-acetyl-ADP-ribose deacetylase [Paenibacillus silvae]MCK6266909.1 O-acetyl-ADP-ribose deacetylase [Paenibacillus silvae]
MEAKVNQTIIEVLKGDITKSQLDSIVNAANTSLLGGGGVDGAIHRAGGKAILDECIKIRNKQGNCPVGEAVITTGGRLKAKYVIHTVGPVWNGGNNNEAEKLKNCYTNTLKLAVHNHLQSISIPNISTGIYKYPKREASEIAINTVAEFINRNESILHIQFVCFDDENYEIYKESLKKYV